MKSLFMAFITALAFAWTMVGAVEVSDDCVNCHETAPIPDNHEPVTSSSVLQCIECHKAEPGDPFVLVMHEAHLDMGFECLDCHTGTPPSRDALDILLRPDAR